MSLNTLSRGAPSFMRDRSSPLSQLIFYGALALFLMVADARFQIVQPLRSGISALLHPLQWAMLQPVEVVHRGSDYFVALDTAQRDAAEAREAMARLAQRAHQAQDLVEENERLRALLGLRERLEVSAQAGEILYELPDPFSRRVVIDRGSMQGVVPGSPVLDELGVFGQVVRVYPFVSEVMSVSDPDLSIPVVNTRTGVKGVAYGAPGQNPLGAMELRYMASNADIRPGDLLTTSGMDGVYPPGLPVAEVVDVARRADSPFSRVHGTPLARVQGARHVMVLAPLSHHLPDLEAAMDAEHVAPPPPVPPKTPVKPVDAKAQTVTDPRTGGKPAPKPEAKPAAPAKPAAATPAPNRPASAPAAPRSTP